MSDTVTLHILDLPSGKIEALLLPTARGGSWGQAGNTYPYQLTEGTDPDTMNLVITIPKGAIIAPGPEPVTVNLAAETGVVGLVGNAEPAPTT